jgi:succinoglycan biosynthesis protein ExoA
MDTSAPTPVDMSVLVPVLNEGRDLREAVAAMLAQQLDGTFELIFADGRSTDDTRAQLDELAREDPRIRVFDNPRRGTASGLNVCLREARGSYVARMDGHAVYPSNYLHAGIDRLRQGDVAWVAGPQVPEPRGRVSAAVAAALGTRLGRGAGRRWDGAADGAETELDTGVFCGVWRRADVLAHGGWDEAWPRNQDSELAARFLGNGQRIVSLPAMAARYIPRDSFRALWRQYRGYGSYRCKTAKRHPGSLRRSAVLPPLLVVDAVAAVTAPRPLRTIAAAGLLAYAAALAVATTETLRRGRRKQAPLVPAVLATMHAAHGTGFVEGLVRWGVPWRALLGVLRGGVPIAPYRGPIEAPSLRGEDVAG